MGPENSVFGQEIISDLEEDIGPELRASGFERDHQVSLEDWASQQPLQTEDAEELSLNREESGSREMGNIALEDDQHRGSSGKDVINS
jgi:hypothetical protein